MSRKVHERFVEFIDCSVEREADQWRPLLLLRSKNITSGLSLLPKHMTVHHSDGRWHFRSKGQSEWAIKRGFICSLLCIWTQPCVISMLAQNRWKRFFSTLTGISSFSSRSTKRSADLSRFVTRRIPTACETRWNSKARSVSTVHSIFSDLLSFFNDIMDSPQSWDDFTVDAAAGFVSKLKNTEFRFLLEVFQFSLILSCVLTFCRRKCMILCIVLTRLRASKES